MLDTRLDTINLFVIIIVTLIIIICFIGVLIATKFQRKQKKKYKDCVKLINEKENSTLQVKSELSFDDIIKIDSNIDINKLMSDLYDNYLKLQNKLNLLDDDFDDILIGAIKENYKNKVGIFKLKNYKDITERIDLINYSIIEFSPNKLKFRITTNCISYIISNDIIISGNNLQKIEQIIILTYEKQDGKWLISNFEKVYQKPLNS